MLVMLQQHFVLITRRNVFPLDLYLIFRTLSNTFYNRLNILKLFFLTMLELGVFLSVKQVNSPC